MKDDQVVVPGAGGYALAPVVSERIRTLQVVSPITCREEEAGAVDSLTFTQAVIRACETARKGLVDPLNRKVRQINAAFKELMGPAQKAEASIKEVIASYKTEQMAKEQERRRRIEEENARRVAEALAKETKERAEVADATHDAALEAGFTPSEAQELAQLEAEDVNVPVLLEVPPPMPTQVSNGTLGRATVRFRWNWRVVNLHDFLLWVTTGPDPAQWVEVKASAIRSLLPKGDEEPRNVPPGIEFVKQVEVAGTAH